MVITLNNGVKKRIDELGRIVIPKEIRKAFNIRNFDELEISIDNDKIIIKKILKLYKYKEKFYNFMNILSNSLTMLIIEDFKIIASNDSVYVEGDTVIEDVFNDKTINKDLVYGKKSLGLMYYEPIIVESNLLGYMVLISNKELENSNIIKNIKQSIIDFLV